MVSFQYLKITLITAVTIIVSYISFNYFVDSLSVFHQETEVFESYSDVNERFLKSLYLEENCGEIDTIVFGDSRTAGYTTEGIERSFKNSNAFNYGVQSETLIGVYQKLVWLAGKGCFPQNIIIPISIDRIELYDYADDTRLLMQENPLVLKETSSSYEYYLRQWTVFKKYLFSSSIFIKNIKYIQNHIVDRKFHLKFAPTTGDTYYYFDHPCKKNPVEFGKNKLDFDQVDSFIKQLQLIIDYSDGFDSEVVLLWNPQLYSVQMSYGLKSTEYLLHNLGVIAPFINRIALHDARLKDIDLYHDCSHFKKILGKSIFDEQNHIPTLRLQSEFKAEHSKLEGVGNKIEE